MTDEAPNANQQNCHLYHCNVCVSAIFWCSKVLEMFFFIAVSFKTAFSRYFSHINVATFGAINLTCHAMSITRSPPFRLTNQRALPFTLVWSEWIRSLQQPFKRYTNFLNNLNLETLLTLAVQPLVGGSFVVGILVWPVQRWLTRLQLFCTSCLIFLCFLLFSLFLSPLLGSVQWSFFFLISLLSCFVCLEGRIYELMSEFLFIYLTSPN